MEENQKIDIERERGRERIQFYLAGWILTGLGAVLLLLHHFTGLSVQTYLPPCLFHMATGGYCPGCGGTRAATLLLRGNVLASAVCHPVILYGAVLFAWFMVSNTIWLLSGQKLKIAMGGRKWQLWLGLGIAAGNFIWKNVGYFCFGIRLEGWLGML